MANVFDGLTKTLLTSVETVPFIGDTRYAIDPTFPESVPYKYLKVVAGTKTFKGETITTGIVNEMSQPEKDAVDVVDLASAKSIRKTYLQLRGDEYLKERYPNSSVEQLAYIYTDSARLRPHRSGYLIPWVEWKSLIADEIKTKQNAVDAATSVSEVNAIVLDETTLSSQDPEVSIQGAMEQTDVIDLKTFLDENAHVIDPLTSVEGPFWIMQILMNRRELFNDTENPLYHAGFTPLVGTNGSVSNLNNIHGKMGWHNQDIMKAKYTRPKDILVYYGWLNSFNSTTNGWYNEKVAQDMSKYRILVFGDGTQDPSHGDYANTQIIIPRIKALNPCALIFGYVSTNQSYANFQTKTDQWNTLGVHGIMMDESGYDYGTTTTNGREAFNQKVDYIHAQTSAKICFSNAWNTDHILGTANDVSFPNTTWNPSVIESNLNEDDWVMLESFPVNTTAYSGNGGYETASDWAARGSKANTLRSTYKCNFASVNIIANGDINGQDLFDFAFVSSMMWSLEAFGTSDTSYGASSAAVQYWVRPDVSNMGHVYTVNPSIQLDTLDTDVYHRYCEFSRLKLDFSTGAQDSSITKF